MPLISFTCNACGEEFDAFRRLRLQDEPGPPCPRCGAAETVHPDDSLDDASCEVGAGTGPIR